MHFAHHALPLLWMGRTLIAVTALFFALDGIMKLFKPVPVIKATLELGYSESSIVGIGITAIACVALYLIPSTSVLGAVLLTGYLGGAIASKVRIRAPLFDICFALVVALPLWGGLWLTDPLLRAIVPLH